MGRLAHKDAEKKSDDVLAEEARQHLALAPGVQLVAELLVRLRAMSLAWWSAEATRARFPAAQRMEWLAERPDVRQRITSQLTGLAPKAARKKAPDFQASLLDSVVDEGDVTAHDFEDAFDPVELATYGDAAAFWRAFLERFPWDDEARESQELATWLLEALLANTSGLDGAFARKPLLTPLDVRAAIDGSVWHTRVPLEVRVGIDRARLAQERERPSQPFGADAELAIATPMVLASNLPLRALGGVWAAAEVALGFGDGATARLAASTASQPTAGSVAVAPAGSAPVSHAVTAPKAHAGSSKVDAPAAIAPPSRVPYEPPPASLARPVPASIPPIPPSVAPPPSLSPPPFPGSAAGRVESRTAPSADVASLLSIRATIPDTESSPRSAAPPTSGKGPPPLPGSREAERLGSSGGPPSGRVNSAALPPPPPHPASSGHVQPPAMVRGKGGAPTRSAAGEAFDDALATGDLDVESTNPWDTPAPEDAPPEPSAPSTRPRR